MRFQLAVSTPELVASSLHRLAPAGRTRTARTGFTHLHDIDPDISEREVDSVEQLSMRPEGVRLLVHRRRPVSIEHIGEIAHVDGVDVPRQQPLCGVFDDGIAGVVALPPTFVVEAFDLAAGMPTVGKLGLQLGDAFRQAAKSVELRPGMVHRCIALISDDGEGVVCADVDGRPVGRVLGVECMSEAILPLFPEVGWLYADGMGDANPVGGLVVGEFYPAVVTVPLWIAVNFERESFLMIKVIAVLQHVADAELERTPCFVPVERIEVVADEAVKFVAIVTGAPVTWRTRLLRDRWSGVAVVLLEEPEERPPGVAVLAGNLLAGGFPEDGRVVVVEVVELGLPDVAVVAEVLLAASPDAERPDGPPELRSGDVGM